MRRVFSLFKGTPMTNFAKRFSSWQCLENPDGSIVLYNGSTGKFTTINADCARNGCKKSAPQLSSVKVTALVKYQPPETGFSLVNYVPPKPTITPNYPASYVGC